MPSLTSFLKGPRGAKSQIDNQVSNGIGSHAENDTTEKVQQRQSKRDFFRSLLKRSSINSKSKRRSLDVMVRARSCFYLAKFLSFTLVADNSSTDIQYLATPKDSRYTYKSHVKSKQTSASSPTWRCRARAHFKANAESTENHLPDCSSGTAETLLRSSAILRTIRRTPYRGSTPFGCFPVGFGGGYSGPL
jgi:hypothetical protein